MRIGEIIDRLNRRESLALVAKLIGIAPYTLSKKLRLLGYEYDSARKCRIFVGEGQEPRERSIFEEIKVQSTAVNYEELMYAELAAIRCLLEKRMQPAAANESGERVRKTFSLPAALSGQLEETAKRNGVSRSRLVELALRQWLQTYK